MANGWFPTQECAVVLLINGMPNGFSAIAFAQKIAD
tara:strand:- start:406 stop:513 length:108 start_codon:yes stop_codon:yes gene_type:complete